VRALIALGALTAMSALYGCGSQARRSAPVRASPPVAILQEYTALKAEPARTLQIMRSLGVGVVRLFMEWKQVAAKPTSNVRPAGNAYPASGFGWYDQVDRHAHADGIQIDMLLSSGAPRWALGAGDPANDEFPGAWSPSASEYGRFVAAVAKRYSGHYTPPGAKAPLPRVNFWEFWSEPNWGPSLEPQISLHPTRLSAPSEYRRLVDAGWDSLARTGHGHDTVVIGNLSPRGTPGSPPSEKAAATWNISPLGFTRALYCVDSSYRPLRGAAAIEDGCPPNADAFQRDHPGLLRVAGYGIHPYPVNLPPTKADTTNPDTVEFSQIPNLVSALDRIERTYGSTHRIAVYNTEYGYVTNPPNPNPVNLHPPTAAAYLNWAEYLTWRNPRIASSMQYGLYDAPIEHSVFGTGGFASGLILPDGVPKATFYSYRLPIFLPVTRTTPGRPLEVWGCARPAPYAYRDTHQIQRVSVQFRPKSSHHFSTVKDVRLNMAHGCYFDVDVKFPTSGTVRLQWSYPRGDRRLIDPVTPGQTTIQSRQVEISIH
jgi:hypothetical protein